MIWDSSVEGGHGAKFCPGLVDGAFPTCYIEWVLRVILWPACSVWLCCIDVYPVEWYSQDVLAETCLRFRWSFPVGMQAEATKRSALVPDLRTGFRAGLRNDHGATVVRLT